jgi:cell division transport system permease protein
MISLRPSGFDELGLRRALSDRMLPLLVAAMAFLAALALAGWFGTAALSQHWQQGAGASLTVQVPQPADASARPGQTRLAAVLALLSGTKGIVSAHALSDQELADLLKPWLGQGGQGADRLAIPIPAVIAVRLSESAIDLAPLSARLSEAAPGTLVEDHGVWIRRLAVLARSLQACAGLALMLVGLVAAAVIAVATRAGLSTRRGAIEIVHGLGATDSYIAGRFAARATVLAAVGAAAGAVAALPILLALARMAAPFVAHAGVAQASVPQVGAAQAGAVDAGALHSGLGGAPGDMLQDALATLPAALWLALPCLPLTAAVIGFATAQTAVRRWLRRLP